MELIKRKDIENQEIDQITSKIRANPEKQYLKLTLKYDSVVFI